MRFVELGNYFAASLFAALLCIILVQWDKIKRQKSERDPFQKAFFFGDCHYFLSTTLGEIELRGSEDDLPIALAELAYSTENAPFRVEIFNSQPFYYLSFEVFAKYSVSAIIASSMKVTSLNLVLHHCSASSIYLPNCKSVYISLQDCPNLEKLVFVGAPPELDNTDDFILCNVAPDFAFHVPAEHLDAYRKSAYARFRVRGADYNSSPVRILEGEPVYVRV